MFGKKKIAVAAPGAGAGAGFSRALQGRTRKAEGLKAGPLFVAVAVQAALLMGTVFIGFLIPQMRSEPEFSAKKTIYLPQRELEHEMAVAEFQQVASPPVMIDRLTTSALLPDNLPTLPDLPPVEMDPMLQDNPLADVDALLGNSGLLAAVQGLDTKASSASLFGIDDSGERILILFDDGGSVLTKAERSGVPIDKIKEEAVKLVGGLNANTLFGFVNFVRLVGTFNDYLVPATAANKRAAKSWIEDKFGSYRKDTALAYRPDGIQGALQVAFQLGPDVIFLISDADFQRNVPGTKGEDVPWDDLEKTLETLQKDSPRKVRLHFIGFQVREEDAEPMERLAKRYGGKYRVIGE